MTGSLFSLEVIFLKVNILGTKYTIKETCKEKDSFLEKCDGYCDKTTRTIVITTEPKDSELGCWDIYRKKILRHEIIHAFLFESGLHENFQHQEFGHEETFIDWFAAQYPKIKAVYIAVGCDE